MKKKEVPQQTFSERIDAVEFIPQFSKEQIAFQKEMLNQTQNEFKATLEQTKEMYPFNGWHEYLYKENKLQQYTKENCEQAEKIMNNLINNLLTLGLNAPEVDKIAFFKRATESYNLLNEETDWELIETEEREDLCSIIDQIGRNCGLLPEKYGDGDGIASEWRDW